MATSSLLALVVARPTVLAPPSLTQGFIANNVDGSKGGGKASRENSMHPPPRNLPAFPCLSSRLVFFPKPLLIRPTPLESEHILATGLLVKPFAPQWLWAFSLEFPGSPGVRAEGSHGWT